MTTHLPLEVKTWDCTILGAEQLALGCVNATFIVPYFLGREIMQPRAYLFAPPCVLWAFTRPTVSSPLIHFLDFFNRSPDKRGPNLTERAAEG